MQAPDPEEAAVLYGFANLTSLFAVVDDDFVSLWKGGRRRSSLIPGAWLSETQKNLDAIESSIGPFTETQQLDISITRQWLHILAWQVGVGQGLLWQSDNERMKLEYPIEVAKEVVRITTQASRLALDSHGIGMVGGTNLTRDTSRI